MPGRVEPASTHAEGILLARQQVRELEAAIADLAGKRSRLLTYIEVAEAMLAAAPAGMEDRPSLATGKAGGKVAGKAAGTVRQAARVPPRQVSPAPVVGLELAKTLDADTRTRMVSDRRAYMREVVATVADILKRAGRPLSAEELHAALPQRDHISEELLYRTLHKRIEKGKIFTFGSGRFGLRDGAGQAGADGDEP